MFARWFPNPRPFLITAAALAASASGLALSFASIDFPGAAGTVANGINAQGDIVGEYIDAGGKSHGFLRHADVLSSIDFPGASFTSAKAINLAGDIVGWCGAGTADLRGFLWRGGVFTTVNGPNGTPAVANGINTAGDIVGSYSDSAGNHGFLLSGGVYTTIDYPANYCCSSGAPKNSQALGINRLGDIVGGYLPFLNSFGYLLQAGVFTSISSPSDQNIAYGVNAQGDIACTVFDAIGQHNHGFRLSGGVLTLIDFPGAALGTVVHGINDLGDIVGGYGCYATCMAHGFVAIAGGDAPPIIAPQVAGMAGNGGWYVSNVTVSWSVIDPSGIASSSGCGTISIATDTAGVKLTCTATNVAGLTSSSSVTIKIERTPPVLSGMPAQPCTLWPPDRMLVPVADVKASSPMSGLVPGSFRVTATGSLPPSDPKMSRCRDHAGWSRGLRRPTP